MGFNTFFFLLPGISQMESARVRFLWFFFGNLFLDFSIFIKDF